jgi:hypothetical protein
MSFGHGEGSVGATLASVSIGAEATGGALDALGAAGASDFGRSVDGVFELLHATRRIAANDFFTTK